MSKKVTFYDITGKPQTLDRPVFMDISLFPWPDLRIVCPLGIVVDASSNKRANYLGFWIE
jgi:hypothetical protein